MPKGFSKVNNNWTEEELSFLRKNKFLTASELAETLGRTPKAIRSMFSKLGIRRKEIINEVWTKMELETLKQNANRPMVELMLLLPTRSEWGIKHKYQQLGIDRDSFGKNKTKEFAIPQESEDFAYFLGALCSDGWNSGNSIGLSVKDKEFADAFGEIGFRLFGIPFISRKIKKSHLKNHSDLYEVQFVSRGLCKWFGDVSEKAWFNNIKLGFISSNELFTLAFLSGYIDGDGHVSTFKYITIASKLDGAKQFLSELILKFGNGFVVDSGVIRLNKPLVDRIRNKLTLKIKRKSEALRW